MRHLILVRHSHPAIRRDSPASAWHLSEKGFNAMPALAEKLSVYQPCDIFSSREPKAVETASRLGVDLALEPQLESDLHEHLRESVGWFDNEQDRTAAIKRMFDHPNTLVFGEETAHAALMRFSAAVNSIMLRTAAQNVIIVTHGTVMALYVAHYNTVDVFQWWQGLTLPDYVVLKWPERTFVEGAGADLF